MSSTTDLKEWRKHASAFSRRIILVCCGDQHSGLAPDTGARAALRRGVGEPVAHFGQSAHRRILMEATAVGPEAVQQAWLNGVFPYQAAAWERAYYAVAAMIAAQPRTARDALVDLDPTTQRFGVGAATGRLDRAAKVPNDDTSPRERELAALSRLSLDGVHRRLPKLVRLVTTGQHPQQLDWGELIVDLARWPQRREDIIKRWNLAYYRERLSRRQDVPSSPDTETTENEAA
jgi:CRISPR type I-E-associated protein CasB/Cse2